MTDAMSRKFNKAKNELQGNETEQEQSKDDELDFKHIQEVLSNKQLLKILKEIEKLNKQNEIMQKRAITQMQISLENYLDAQVVDATAAILREHTAIMQGMMSHNKKLVAELNEKLGMLLCGIITSLVMLAAYLSYIRWM